MTLHLQIAPLRAGAACALAGVLCLACAGPRSRYAAATHLPAGKAAANSAVRGTALSKFVLSLQDVTAAYGGGFIRQSGITPDSDILGSRLNAKIGRIGGNETRYVRQHPNATMVASGVNLYRNAGFASASVRRIYTVYTNPQNRKDGVKMEHVQGLGDTSFLLTYDLGSQSGVHFRELCVMFSEGAYAADVILVSTGSPDRGKLLSLASEIDGRIKSA